MKMNTQEPTANELIAFEGEKGILALYDLSHLSSIVFIKMDPLYSA